MSSCNQSSNNTQVDDLVVEVGIFLPGIATPIVKAALMRAIMSVVDKSKVLYYEVTQDLFENVKDYQIELPNCTSVLKIDEVKINGSLVEYEVKNNDWIIISGSYGNVEGGLVARVNAGITRESCEIPTFIYERYGDVIINASLSILYGMYGEDWYDPNMVKFYGGISKGGVDNIKQNILDQAVPDGVRIDTSGGLIV